MVADAADAGIMFLFSHLLLLWPAVNAIVCFALDCALVTDGPDYCNRNPPKECLEFDDIRGEIALQLGLIVDNG